MIGLIDGDILVFRAGFAAERNSWFLNVPVPNARGAEPYSGQFSYKKDALKKLDELLPGKYSRTDGTDYHMWSERQVEPVQNALHLVNLQMAKIMEACSLNEFDVMVYLSGGVNYRYEVAKTKPYKGNRDDAHRPTHEEAIKDHIKARWNTTVTDGIEADDAMGIAQTQIEGESCIISIDKDLDMIPGLHYNFLHEVHYEITEDEGWHKFCVQLMTGDATDNIPGIEGIGPKKAEKALDGLPSCDWIEEVARVYASKSGREDWFDYMIEQGTLIWIQQYGQLVPPIPQELKEIGGTDGEETTQDDTATVAPSLWD
jgi:hypothetical protein